MITKTHNTTKSNKTFTKNDLLIFLLLFISGILVGKYGAIYWAIAFTLWVFSIFLSLLFHFYWNTHWKWRKWMTLSIFSTLFLSGLFTSTLHSPTFYTKEFSENYLKGDYLIGEIRDYQEGKGKFDKAIISVERIVKHYKKEQIIAQGDLLCYINTEKVPYQIGEVLIFQANLMDITNKNNPGEFDAEKYWRSQGITKMTFLNDSEIQLIDTRKSFVGFWDNSRKYVMQIIDKYVSPENRGLAIALTLGDKSRLSVEQKSHFTDAGAMHVLAVSGMHVGILLMFIQFIFKQIPPLRKRNLYLYCAIIILWCFAFLTGMSASVLRAVLMFSIMAIGRFTGKKFFSLNAIFSSALLLLLVNPSFIEDIGFQLSYLAVIGISLFFKPITNLFHSRYKLVNYFWEGSALGIAAQIGTLPLTLYYFHQFPNYFFLTNLGVLVMASAAMISVVILCLIHFIPFLNVLVGWAVDFIFNSFSAFIGWINSLPAVVSTGFSIYFLQVILLYVGILSLLYLKRKENLKLFNVGIISVFFVLLSVIFVRENNRVKEELIIFNASQKIIALKQSNAVYIFYEEGKNKKVDDFLIGSYESSIGMESELIPIQPDKTICFSDFLSFKNHENGIYVDYYDSKFFLADFLRTHQESDDYQIIKGNWSPYLEEERIAISTIDKALIVKPN